MNDQEKRVKLAEAIDKEFQNLPETNMFEEQKDYEDHERSMTYLKTGEYEEDDDYLDGEYLELMSLVDQGDDLSDYYSDYDIED